MAGQSSWASAAAAGSPLGRGSVSGGADRHKGDSEMGELMEERAPEVPGVRGCGWRVWGAGSWPGGC